MEKIASAMGSVRGCSGSEGIWPRAIRDSAESARTVPFQVIAAVTTVLSAALADAVPLGAWTDVQRLFVSLSAAVVGVLVALGALLMVKLVGSPFRQRDEARAELSALSSPLDVTVSGGTLSRRQVALDRPLHVYSNSRLFEFYGSEVICFLGVTVTNRESVPVSVSLRLVVHVPELQGAEFSDDWFIESFLTKPPPEILQQLNDRVGVEPMLTPPLNIPPRSSAAGWIGFLVPRDLKGLARASGASLATHKLEEFQIYDFASGRTARIPFGSKGGR